MRLASDGLQSTPTGCMARGSPRRWVFCGAGAVLVLFCFLSGVPYYYSGIDQLEDSNDRHRRENGGAGESAKRSLEIWSLTSAGIYLWSHVLKGTLAASAGGRLSVGEKEVGPWTIRFTNGKDLAPEYIKPDTEYLVLALNGRSDAVTATLFHWLQELRSLKQLKRVGLLLIGRENCEGKWLLSLLSQLPGIDKKIGAVWMTYDHPLVDGARFFQWPLGVASYRNFPVAPVAESSLIQPRPYRCNFLGTVYPGSTRVLLPSILKKINSERTSCFVKIRTEWVAHEKADSMDTYQHALKSSDLTLCPAGKNAESYRIYEAMAMGSVPVLEIEDPTRTCQTPVNNGMLLPRGMAAVSRPQSEQVTGPYRLLKSLHAPVIYVASWTELPALMEREHSLTLEQVTQRRLNLVKWYKDFQEILSQSFLHSLESMAGGEL